MCLGHCTLTESLSCVRTPSKIRWRESLAILFLLFHGWPLLLPTALAQRLHCPLQAPAGPRLLRFPPRLRLALPHPRISREPFSPRFPGLVPTRSHLPSPPF